MHLSKKIMNNISNQLSAGKLVDCLMLVATSRAIAFLSDKELLLLGAPDLGQYLQKVCLRYYCLLQRTQGDIIGEAALLNDKPR